MTEKPVQPSEAGFSTNLYLNNEKSGRVQFTFRGAFSEDWPTVMTNVHAFLVDMHEKGWMLDGEWAAQKKIPPKDNTVPMAELPPDLPTMAEGGASEYFKENFDSFEIAPQPDGKASVKFLKDGMKYPVGAPVNKWKNQSVAEILAPLGEFDVTKAQIVRVAGVQYYVNGNEYTNQKGEKKHYKDLKRVEKAL
jgi:hypothetical protein